MLCYLLAAAPPPVEVSSFGTALMPPDHCLDWIQRWVPGFVGAQISAVFCTGRESAQYCAAASVLCLFHPMLVSGVLFPC
ncbi:hypothetical protein PDJAM_G00185340 [Pangasius djambal]|uniref:Uncharacterized protein n=1 Tax=Pangasius djambal TaxID=1691987 RepID=A0ACC5Y4G3_9TELE|nr:hypothetical protein [Pangasius djambal]